MQQLHHQHCVKLPDLFVQQLGSLVRMVALLLSLLGNSLELLQVVCSVGPLPQPVCKQRCR